MPVQGVRASHARDDEPRYGWSARASSYVREVLAKHRFYPEVFLAPLRNEAEMDEEFKRARASMIQGRGAEGKIKLWELAGAGHNDARTELAYYFDGGFFLCEHSPEVAAFVRSVSASDVIVRRTKRRSEGDPDCTWMCCEMLAQFCWWMCRGLCGEGKEA